MGEAMPSTGRGMREAVPTMGVGMGQAVPTTGMGSKWDGRMLDRPSGQQVVVKFIVGWAGWDGDLQIYGGIPGPFLFRSHSLP